MTLGSDDLRKHLQPPEAWLLHKRLRRQWEEQQRFERQWDALTRPPRLLEEGRRLAQTSTFMSAFTAPDRLVSQLNETWS